MSTVRLVRRVDSYSLGQILDISSLRKKCVSNYFLDFFGNFAFFQMGPKFEPKNFELQTLEIKYILYRSFDRLLIVKFRNFKFDLKHNFFNNYKTRCRLPKFELKKILVEKNI